MRAYQNGSVELREIEVGPFHIRAPQVATSQICLLKFQSLLRPVIFSVPPANDSEDGLDVDWAAAPSLFALPHAPPWLRAAVKVPSHARKP